MTSPTEANICGNEVSVFHYRAMQTTTLNT